MMGTILKRIRWNFSAPAMLDEMCERMGDTFDLNLIPGADFVVTRDPELVKAIFADNGKHLHAGSANRLVLGRFLGDGSVLLLDGARHKAHRKVMVPCFHGQILKDHVENMRAIIAENISRWPRRKWVSFLPLAQDISLEIIVKSLFGFRSEHRDYARVLKVIRRIFANSSATSSLFIFFPRLFDFAGKVTTRVSDLENAFRELAQVIEAHSKSSELNEKSILAHFIRAQAESDAKFSFAEIADEMIGLLLAGNETTAVAMSWAVYWLHHDPKILASIRKSLADEPDATKNRLVDAFVKEVLRMSPIFVLVAREVVDDFVAGGRTFSKGARLAPSIYLANRNAKVFPEPETFRLERFLERDPATYEYFPFGGGERRCIGYALATLELKLLVGALIDGPEVELRDRSVPRPERRGIAFTPHRGLRVKFD